jgi:VanZ family protein
VTTKGKQLLSRWLPLFVWMLLIFIVSAQPKQAVPSFGVWDLLVKKGSHFLAYALLAWLAWRALGEGQGLYRWAFVLTAVYAVSDEFHQTFVPGRNGQLSDVFIDCAGGLSALILLKWGQARRSFQPRRWTSSP